MSCNSCCKTFSLLRKEIGCPGCGFSYCSKCLCQKMFLPKLNAEVKVCGKCRKVEISAKTEIEPPSAYLKRVENLGSLMTEKDIDPVEDEIRKRLEKLKNDKIISNKGSDRNISERLKKLKDIPSTSQAEIEERLANIKGVPIGAVQSKPVLPKPDLRTESEQASDLMKQYLSQTSIDKKYEDEFEEKISDIETRLQKLKDSTTYDKLKINNNPNMESEDDIIKKIIEEAKLEPDEDISSAINDELPFCEICNEDATMRCLGCKYLFCKQCFMEHKDDDDGCNKYEKYTAPKSFNY